MSESITREEIIRAALDRIASKQNPTIVEINERVKRRYWM